MSVNPSQYSGLHQRGNTRRTDHIPLCLVHSETSEAGMVVVLGGWRAASSGEETEVTVSLGHLDQNVFKGWDKARQRSKPGR